MDKYEEIDKSMSDSQIGGRKGKNVRDHIWIINGIITEVLSKKSNIPVPKIKFSKKNPRIGNLMLILIFHRALRSCL